MTLPGGDGYELALVGWIAGRSCALSGLILDAPVAWVVRRANWVGFLLLSGIGFGLAASFSDDATFASTTAWTQLVLWLVLLATYSLRVAGLATAASAIWWWTGSHDIATAFGTFTPRGSGSPDMVSPYVSCALGLVSVALFLGTRPRWWRLALAFVAALLEWWWVSTHLWLPEAHGFPDRVDVVAMAPALRSPFLAVWSGIGFAGWLSACLVRLAPRESS